MPYLTPEQINELTDESLEGYMLKVRRGNELSEYQLQECASNGMKGVVWKATTAIGVPVAVKFTLHSDYIERSLADELTLASRLSHYHFTRVRFFGRADEETPINGSVYDVIVTDWVDGVNWLKFISEEHLSVDEFLNLAEQLCTSLAVLNAENLCHDDLHPGNVLLEKDWNPLTKKNELRLRVIDTGTIKRVSTRNSMLQELRKRIKVIEDAGVDEPSLREFLAWKEPDDHLRVVECLLHAANSLVKSYPSASLWERRFIDSLGPVFERMVEEDKSRRLDEPSQVVSELRALATSCKASEEKRPVALTSPFDYISAEMIRDDREFSELFSRECPWLEDCRAIEPLYLYGPRGCGKSSVLRWLSFRSVLADPARKNFHELREIGVYMSCSEELRSRFWLLEEAVIEAMQAPIIRFFSLLLLEELFDTLSIMSALERAKEFDFGLQTANLDELTRLILERIALDAGTSTYRLQGQGHFVYLRDTARRLRWRLWRDIQQLDPGKGLPDPSLVSEVARLVRKFLPYFNERHLTFLIDDYSNQRIPASLQRKLNQTISFAKQGAPIFKVSSEYNGVDLEGIEEGREVREINIGDKYTSLLGARSDFSFLVDILDRRFGAAGFVGKTLDLIGASDYGEDLPTALVRDAEKGPPFYYYGIDTINVLCSGDVALALDLIRKIFESAGVTKDSTTPVLPHEQHRSIQQYSHNEVQRVRYLVPYGEEIFQVVHALGSLARTVVLNKRSKRRDKRGKPMCKTHLDVRLEAVVGVNKEGGKVASIYEMLTSRAILFSLETSRSRLKGATERLQMRRIYFPAFKAPAKRDNPIKLDTADDLRSLISDPKTWLERELQRSGIDPDQGVLALEGAVIGPEGGTGGH